MQHQWFREIAVAHPTVPGRAIRSFEMTRDGFTLLAMGFTGDEALEWKIKYLEAFNTMETKLGSSPTSTTPRSPSMRRSNSESTAAGASKNSTPAIS